MKETNAISPRKLNGIETPGKSQEIETSLLSLQIFHVGSPSIHRLIYTSYLRYFKLLNAGST